MNKIIYALGISSITVIVSILLLSFLMLGFDWLYIDTVNHAGVHTSVISRFLLVCIVSVTFLVSMRSYSNTGTSNDQN